MKDRTKEPLPPFEIYFGGGFALLAGLLYFLDSSGLFAALVPSVVIHELGHLLALVWLRAPPRRLSAALSGFSIDYVGELSVPGRLAAALAGPVFGLAFALLCSRLGIRFGSLFLLTAAGVSCALSVFNLLPVFPLDGGQAFEALLRLCFGKGVSRKVMAALGLAVPGGMIYAGLGPVRSPALAAMGVWLLVRELPRGRLSGTHK